MDYKGTNQIMKKTTFILNITLFTSLMSQCAYTAPISPGTSSIPTKENFSFAVFADPQAFRLKKGGDPNSKSQNGAEWHRINKNLVSAVNKVPDISFGIINGDITEFGRTSSWDAVSGIFDKLRFPYYFGLGNHDYQNNKNDCWTAYWFSMDGCAIDSVQKLIKHQAAIELSSRLNQSAFGSVIKKQQGITNFSSDMTADKGSLAYSWDYKHVHFVQLNLHPDYSVKLNSSLQKPKYDIIPSLTWLGDDLRKARFRGVSNVILNMHEEGDDFRRNSSDYARRQFQAIMLTYKPLAVFVGHTHMFDRDAHSNHPFYGNTPVYTTGAAFDGKFHQVNFNEVSRTLTIREMDGITGTPVELKTYTEKVPTPTPVCKMTGIFGYKGDIYMSPFMPAKAEWNLNQVLRSGNNVDASKSGSGYMRPWNAGNPYQMWAFERMYGNEMPEYNAWYLIRQRATGRVLDSNASGAVYTKPATANNYYQQWRPIKTERGEMMLVNRATNRVLDGNGNRLYTTPGYEMFNQYKAWKVSQGWTRKSPENVRFFKAKQADSWRKAYPSGANSNIYWQYLGEHNLLSPSPCIGW